MKTISWQSFSSSKLLRVFFTILMVVFWTACADDSQNIQGPDADAASKGSLKSTSSFSDYNISVVVSTDGTLWTYTIDKAKSSAKTLSHLIINLGNCGDESATFSDIIEATVNGTPAYFVNTEGSGTTCNPQATTNNFVKIGNFPAVSTWVIVIKFDRGYSQVSTSGWVKAGTSCNSGAIPGPGCPIGEYCSMSQGYYFATGSFTNGADDVWTAAQGLTIGGQNYSHTEGASFWDVNTGRGAADEMRAFFQLGALKLSNVNPTDLTDEIATVEAYFVALPKVAITTCTETNGPHVVSFNCFNLPVSNDVRVAAGTIGQWIDANHCTETN